MAVIHPKSYELVGLALLGTCMGFLLPYWVPDLGASVATQLMTFVRSVQTLTVREWAGLGFWLGVVFVVRGAHLRWRDGLSEGP